MPDVQAEVQINKHHCRVVVGVGTQAPGICKISKLILKCREVLSPCTLGNLNIQLL